ncbi:NERD domain-containing protein [Bacillus sp. CMF21]|uniref:nuclease-related domain-containing protein n=1 Tax=Metabacillus dongyingensis TaxID=2874282 RepID=UPI001CC053D9|nr:nuclease-related domain-containing protein [Metabacillus dongyingensis]UAL51375.1 NERD domain-containing protein [Metabacillus dongyingensis]USK27677.1 NERD domain-containing protein [Bacillus sp. CMF21]
MAQLIKIHSCISRYEMDLYRYQSQFLRLKKQQWQMIMYAYENNEFQQFVRPQTETMDGAEGKKEKENFLRKVRNRLGKKGEIISCDLNIPAADQQAETMEYIFDTVPQSLDELKAKFMNHIFQFQMKWATSTIREKSFADASFYENERLLELLQKLPDQHLIMYNPVFKIKNTSIGLDPILISPGEIVCIHYLEGGQHDVIEGSSERFWTVNPGDHEKKQLSPLISLNRTGTIVKQLLKESKINLEVKKVLVYKSGFIEFPEAPFDLTLADKRNFNGWFQTYRNSTSPIKHDQLKAAEILLSKCLIDSFRRND